MKPLIGVTKPLKGGLIQSIAIRIAVFLAGGRAINLTPDKPRFDRQVDGIILAGGTDIHPELYKSSDIKKDYKYDRERDEMEQAWLKIANEKKTPTLCICRGAQLLNVFFGGSLIYDISKTWKSLNYPNTVWGKVFFRKNAYFLKGRLQNIFGKNPIEINSLHSQALGKLGADLEKTLIEENGIIQGIEHKNHPFLVGVQFHPEFLTYQRSFRRFFETFVQAALDSKKDTMI